ncbi:scarecrow-like protein 33 [Malania oleifera]|uniref:scarecrow-like protein 33 n=1 Tax=Malania oleifera TaxID=397392 RepID=UPI0025ADF39B|nr:scarecrow-like protein 33 [Malania oleifera]
MDSRSRGFSNSINMLQLNDEPVYTNPDQHPSVKSGFKFKNNSLDLKFIDFLSVPPKPDPPSTVRSELDSQNDSNSSDTALRCLGHVVMEEDMEQKSCILREPLALQVADKPFYDFLGGCSSSDSNPLQNFSSDCSSSNSNGTSNSLEPIDNFTSCCSHSSSNCTSNSVEAWWINGQGEYRPSLLQSMSESASQACFSSLNSSNASSNGLVDSSVSTLLAPNLCFENKPILQLTREGGKASEFLNLLLHSSKKNEAAKFLHFENPLDIDFENNKLPPKSKRDAPMVAFEVEKEDKEYSPNGSRGRKNHHREDLEEGRSNKQSAICVEEEEFSEMFDRFLICAHRHNHPLGCSIDHEFSKNKAGKLCQQNGLNTGKSCAKKQGNKNQAVDLGTLLIHFARAVTADDRRAVNELLKEIRQHSSPFGDGSQRIAHYFANGLEARLSGTGTKIHSALATKRMSAVDMLKAGLFYSSVAPFRKIAILFANHHILNLAEKATTLHIIDFGIHYGFQWPVVIQYLSDRLGGPPKLRITGIELLQPGFQPAERVEATGRRLARFCERFNVPFEYNAIAQKWETIQAEDLKIERNEVIAVNCLFRFENLLDETVVEKCPRNAVLNLIRKVNPDIFIHSIVNGSYNSPFFLTRFREALFHYSALFDMLDTTLTCENQERLMFEKEFYGREAMNVIACEGSEMVERPETYKKWHVRNTRAGFRQLPLNRELMNNLRADVKASYHKDFVVDEDGHWMLQGWKGRILYASSCWIPA